MLISGREKLERMRDGRVVYIGAERVNDVTSHILSFVLRCAGQGIPLPSLRVKDRIELAISSSPERRLQ